MQLKIDLDTISLVSSCLVRYYTAEDTYDPTQALKLMVEHYPSDRDTREAGAQIRASLHPKWRVPGCSDWQLKVAWDAAGSVLASRCSLSDPIISTWERLYGRGYKPKS